MKGFKKCLVAGIAAGAVIAGSSAFATAADFEAPVVAKDWTGFWLGGGGGYGSVNHELSLTGDVAEIPIGGGAPLAELGLAAFLSGVGGEGGVGIIGGGYDYDFGNNFVIGVYGDYAFSGIESRLGVGAIDTGILGPGELEFNYKLEAENGWSVGGRIGYLVNPDTLFYGLIGYSEWDFKGRFFAGLGGIDDGGAIGGSYGWTQGGLHFGGGLETRFTENVSLKAEYRYTDLDSKRIFEAPLFFDAGPDEDIIGGIGARTSTNIQTFMVTVNWRF